MKEKIPDEIREWFREKGREGQRRFKAKYTKEQISEIRLRAARTKAKNRAEKQKKLSTG